ncbi:MAG: ABC transporter permease [Candidatus Hermodarchaeota archaeon]
MSKTIQESQEQAQNDRETRDLKLGSKIYNGFKFLLIPKFRLEQFIVANNESLPRKKRSKIGNMLKSSFTFTGAILLFLIITFAVFGPWIAPYSYYEANGHFLDRWEPPSPEHLLGTGFWGRDVLSRLIYGTSSSLVIALLAVSISVLFGIFLGMLAGYYGKWFDSFIMRIMDMILAFPGIIFALAFLAIIGSTMEHIIAILGVIGIPYYSRLTRASVLKVRELDYIAAAKVSGAKNLRIMFIHILPNSIQPIIISMTFDVGRLIISVVTLAFLGFTDPQYINWGSDIYLARAHLYEAPWALFWPSVMISISVIGFMIIGDGLRDALDPKYQVLTR